MKFLAKLKGFKKILGMEAKIRTTSGEILDSITIKKQGAKLEFDIDKSAALEGKKRNNLIISFTDINGESENLSKRNSKILADMNSDSQEFTVKLRSKSKSGKANIKLANNRLDTKPPVFKTGSAASADENIDAGSLIYSAIITDKSKPFSLSLSGVDANLLSISQNDDLTASVTINNSPDFETKSSYAFNVIATDARGNTSTQDITLSINDIEEGKIIPLAPLVDTIIANDLSRQDDVITADLGTLGVDFQDTIFDSSTTDSDLLSIQTNGVFDLSESLDASEISRIQNIEKIQIIASNDDLNGGQEIDLNNVVSLKTLDVDGTFTQKLKLKNWTNTGATEFDFSDITSTQGTDLDFADAGNQNFTGDIVYKGSAGADNFEGILGNVTMQGFAGNDKLTGSRQGASVIEGGAGTDDIDLFNHNAQHTVRLHGQTSETSKDTIIGDTFQGFNNAEAQDLNSFDLLEIDAAAFSNYSAGQVVEQQDINNVLATTNLSNTVVTAASQAGLEAEDFSNNGNGILGFAADTGMLLYSASGNFNQDAQELLEIGAAEGANFVPTRQINVI